MKSIDEILNKINSIQKKSNSLKKKSEQLELDNKDLIFQISKTKKLLEIQNNTIKELENKLKTKLLAETLSNHEKISSNDSRKIKLKINEMIKEIDLVISQLNQ